jgi:hypothetical protein
MAAEGSAELWLTTYRRGMLARLGHDLRLALGSFEVELDGARLRARFDLRSLRVLGAVERGRVRIDVPGAADKASIERAVAREILHTDDHPEALLEGELSATDETRRRFDGQLQLCGRSAPLRAEIDTEPTFLRSTLELVPSRWGIAPYRALGGALRLDDCVGVEIALATECEGFELGRWNASKARWAARG